METGMKLHTMRTTLIAFLAANVACVGGCVYDAPPDSGAPPATPGRSDDLAGLPQAALPAGDAIAFTRAEDTSTFGVYIERGGASTKVLSVPVNGHVNELTVDATVTRDGRRFAIIPNHDTYAGSQLRTVAIDEGGQERVVEDGLVSSSAWSPDGGELAYVAMAGGTPRVKISDGLGAGRTIAEVDAGSMRLLGWSKDATDLYVVIDKGYELPLYTFATLDVATGEVTAVFASDPGASVFFRDFRLVQTDDGDVFVSFIKSSTEDPCDGTSSLNLATVNGSLVAERGVTTDAYRFAQWSSDGADVAYETRACVDKRDPAAALARIEAFTGLYIERSGAASAEKVVSGALSDYGIASLNDGAVRLTSPTRGVRVLDAMVTKSLGRHVTVEQIEPDMPLATGLGAPGLASITSPPSDLAPSLDNTAHYIHQLWDTADWFNGKSACGPTSAVMALAGYQLSEWPQTVSKPSVHTSKYGKYVHDQYTYNGYTFSASSKDPSGNWAKGAYGFIVKDFNQGAIWANVTSYLSKHVPWVKEGWPADGPTWVKQRLSEGYLVVASGQVFGFSHLILIKGYTSDGKFIVHDPYGNKLSKDYDGANVIYTWANISPKRFWAA